MPTCGAHPHYFSAHPPRVRVHPHKNTAAPLAPKIPCGCCGCGGFSCGCGCPPHPYASLRAAPDTRRAPNQASLCLDRARVFVGVWRLGSLAVLPMSLLSDASTSRDVRGGATWDHTAKSPLEKAIGNKVYERSAKCRNTCAEISTAIGMFLRFSSPNHPGSYLLPLLPFFLRLPFV